jgi:hypothetical protein
MCVPDLRNVCARFEDKALSAINVTLSKSTSVLLLMQWHKDCRRLPLKGGLRSMKSLGRGIGGAILTFAFVFGLYSATTTTAQAQWRNDGQYQRRDRDRGYRRNNDRDWRRNRSWRRDRDRDGIPDRYERNNRYGYGNNGRYGNNGGYGNYGGYGGNNNAYQIALNQGYQQGLHTGASDGQRGQSYSPQRSRHYRNASSQAYRDGFVQGYDEGYRRYAGSNGDYRRGNSGLGGILGEILGRP